MQKMKKEKDDTAVRVTITIMIMPLKSVAPIGTKEEIEEA
jgi:hypothetical protein